MATIFKRGRDKNRRNVPYRVEYIGENGKRRRVVGFTDYNLSVELGAKLERDVRLRKQGLVDPAADKLAESRNRPIADHLSEFEKSMRQRRTTTKHIKLTMNRVKAVITGVGCTTLAELASEKVQEYLHDEQTEQDWGPKTFNHYVQALDSFGRWLVRTGRSATNPFATLPRQNTEVDIRHQRRALTADEVRQLIDSARASGKRVQGYDGEQRARVYLMSFLTGLRRSELATLTPASFDLGSPTPIVTVAAACSKHRRTDVLPLHPELISTLPTWLTGMKRGQLLFPKLERKKTWLMVKKDLERVGIPYETEEGVADFHAAGRHTHITELLRNGATITEAKELARHTDVKTTMRYTHIGLRDQARALAFLPAPASTPPKSSQCSSQQLCSPTGHKLAKRDKSLRNGTKKPPASTSGKPASYDAAGQSVAELGTSSAQWRRRESNLRAISTQPIPAYAIAKTANSAALHWRCTLIALKVTSCHCSTLSCSE
jgi:integrase